MPAQRFLPLYSIFVFPVLALLAGSGTGESEPCPPSSTAPGAAIVADCPPAPEPPINPEPEPPAPEPEPEPEPPTPEPEPERPAEPNKPNNPSKPNKPNKPSRPNKPNNGSGGVRPSDPSKKDNPKNLGPTVQAPLGPGLANISAGLFSPSEVSAREAITDFDIPPFLLPIYQACGARYQIPWEILASINKIETDFGRLNRVTSSAGAQGWMQFMPGTWEAYGTDANGDGRRDRYNPVDAICAAARYLQASGFSEDQYRALFAYNNADWYVKDVQEGAERYYALPGQFVLGVSNLASNVRSPVWKHSGRLASTAVYRQRSGQSPQRAPALALPPGSLAQSTQELRLQRRGSSPAWGRYLLFADQGGNQYLYGRLKSVLPLATQRRTSGERDSSEPRQNASGRRRAKALIVAPGQRLARTGPDSFWAFRPAGSAGRRWLNPRPMQKQWAALRASGYQGIADKWRRAAGNALALSAGPGLAQRVLNDPSLQIPACDRRHIAAGVIDRRVLAALAAFSSRGYRLLITSMYCGRESSITTSGNISNHSRAAAVDIAAINGQVISAATQGPGSLTDQLARQALSWPGELAPSEVISLLDYPQPAGIAMGDHDDHLHLGWSSSRSPGVSFIPKWSDWQVVERPPFRAGSIVSSTRPVAPPGGKNSSNRRTAPSGR